MKRITLMTIAVLFVFSINTFAAQYYSGGHADVGINYEAGAWDLHIHAEGADIGGIEDVHGEYEPDEIIILVPDHAEHSRQVGSQWDFTGTASDQPLWILPQHEHQVPAGDPHDHDHEVPFLGIGTEELAAGIFVNDQVTLSLASVIGPGHFSLWQTDSFGSPTVFMSSFDPASPTDLMLPAGQHGHYNWGFTAPGVYEVELQASGELVGGSTISGTAIYTFEVIPEPATVSLLSLGFLLAIRKKQI